MLSIYLGLLGFELLLISTSAFHVECSLLLWSIYDVTLNMKCMFVIIMLVMLKSTNVQLYISTIQTNDKQLFFYNTK